MGDTAINGVILETKCKLDDAYQKVTGVDVDTFYTNNSTGAVVAADRSTLLSIRDKSIAIITDVVDNRLSHSKDLRSDNRFLPLEVDTVSNELVVIFRSAHNAWKAQHTFHAYVTLRYD